ncbi:MAG: hypothetical protein GY765_29800 [bacterium]|nr:hypothetical protein [bacterium]
MKRLMVLFLILAATVLLHSQGTQRSYMLVFEAYEYSPRAQEAVQAFLKNNLKKGDQLLIFTPKRFFGFSPQKLRGPKRKLGFEIVKILKKDITSASARYRSTLDNMLRTVQSLSGAISDSESTLDASLQSYAQDREELMNMRGTARERLLKFAEIFNTVKGEKHLLLFFQEEFRPIPAKETMEALRRNTSHAFKAMEIFLGEKYGPDIKLEDVLPPLQKAGVVFHFMYLKEKKIRHSRNAAYVDNAGDFYSIFSKIAEKTGGAKLTSSKPSVFLEKVAQKVDGK